MKKKYFVVLILLCLGCNPTGTNLSRVNPKPVDATPTPTASLFVPPSGTLSDDLPDPVKTTMPNLEDYTFNVRVEFDGILGRVIVDDGELKETPSEYKLKGGKHKIEVFDLVTLCRIADIYFIDKDQTIDLRNKCTSKGN